MKQQKIKVYRTTEGTIFELAFALLTIVVWGIIIWLLHRAPEVVPTHFRLDGTPDSYGSPFGVLFPCLIMTVVGGCMMLGAYFPHTIHMPFKMTTMRQYELAIRMMRIMGLLMPVLTLGIALTSLAMSKPSAWLVLSVIGLIILITIVFTVLIYRAK